jgi:hypothetical protein
MPRPIRPRCPTCGHLEPSAAQRARAVDRQTAYRARLREKQGKQPIRK